MMEKILDGLNLRSIERCLKYEFKQSLQNIPTCDMKRELLLFYTKIFLM